MKFVKILLAIMVWSLAFGTAQADEPVDEDEVVVPPPRTRPPPRPQPAPAPVVAQEEPVTAPAPPFVTMESSSVGVGIGLHWGKGTLQFEGRNHEFSVKGLSVGDLGASRSIAIGQVHNLHELSRFEGSYVAVEAGAAAGSGKSALTMRNANGVVITVTSDQEGGRLRLGPEGLHIAMD